MAAGAHPNESARCSLRAPGAIRQCHFREYAEIFRASIAATRFLESYESILEVGRLQFSRSPIWKYSPGFSCGSFCVALRVEAALLVQELQQLVMHRLIPLRDFHIQQFWSGDRRDRAREIELRLHLQARGRNADVGVDAVSTICPHAFCPTGPNETDARHIRKTSLRGGLATFEIAGWLRKPRRGSCGRLAGDETNQIIT
jgi:hypothetical protein